MYIKELSKEEFDRFTNIYPIKSIYQTSQYGSLMRNQGYNDIYIGLMDDNKMLAASLILVKKESKFKYGYAPRGFLINYDDTNLLSEFTKLLKQYLSKLGIMGLKINPIILKNIYDFDNQKSIANPYYEKIFNDLKLNEYHHLGYNNFFEALKPRFEAIIDLKKPLDVLFKNIKKEYRTKIRSAIKNGVKVYKGNVYTLDTLYEFTKHKYIRDLDYLKDCFRFFCENDMIDIYCTKLDTKQYLQVTQQILTNYENISNSLNKKILSSNINNQKIINKKISNDKLIEIYKNKLIEATNILRTTPDEITTSAAIIIKQGKEATILIDGHDKKYSKLNSKHLLIWQLIEIYKKQGFEKINLGGMSNFVMDSKRYTGLNQFKLNFGSKMYEYAGDFEIIINKMNYNLYRNYVPLKNLIKEKLK
ncbi:MAG: peptidoglycan bridge formation glycyltransferase FemA/FemB family protein [Bacilli bacterium]|nr:peptidoglycan bridge formation glycyltransferase FemA/FemB family protein [Bacilli bacterium]